MSLTFSHKPKSMKYTDMAIYIDANMQYIKNQNEYPEIEGKIFEYLYHIVYALALKSGYFKDFADYDAYACYAASDIFLAIRKKFLHEGEVFHGKTIVPIKSSLNFVKATMFPLKINYQREYFRHTTHPKFEEASEALINTTKEKIRETYRDDLLKSWNSVLDEVPSLLNELMAKIPFRNDKQFISRLKTSVLLTLLNDLTLPNKLKAKLKAKESIWEPEKSLNTLYKTYLNNPDAVVLWHLAEEYKGYVRFTTIKLKKELSKAFNYTIYGSDLSEELVDGIISGRFESSDRDYLSDMKG